MPHGGFILIFFLLFFIPLSLYSGFVMYRKKDERKLRATKLVIWAVVIIVILATNYNRHINTRFDANAIVKSIEKYKSDTGDYPNNLEIIGVSNQHLRKQLGMSGYYYNDGKARLFYSVTYIPFDTYSYNFELKVWQYRSS